MQETFQSPANLADLLPPVAIAAAACYHRSCQDTTIRKERGAPVHGDATPGHGEEMGRPRDLAASALALAALGAAGCDLCAPPPRSPRLMTPGLSELAQSIDDVRPFRPRLSVPSRWSECGAPAAGGGSAAAADCAGNLAAAAPRRARLAAAGRRIEREAREHPSGPTLHALGLWSLLARQDDGKAQLAVARLEQAVGYLPASGELWSDLAAAHYVLAQRSGHSEELVRSLAASDRALRAAPRLQAALFNRALALEGLFLRREAADAWRRYLESDDTSGWAAEAAARLEALRPSRPLQALSLSRRLAVAPPPSLRELVAAALGDPMDALLSAELRWSDGLIPHRGAVLVPGVGGAVARALQLRCGDRMVEEELAAWVKVRGGGPSDPRRALLEAGYEDFRTARALYATLDTTRARTMFERAARALRLGGSPLHLWASYYAAVCRYWQRDLAPAAESFAALREASQRRGYPILGGYAAWMAGLIALSESDFDRGADNYREALAVFDHAGLAQEAAFLRTLLSQLLRMRNDPRSAWDHLYSALAGADLMRNERWRQSLYDEAATSIRTLGEPEAALYFQERALGSALASGQPVVISEGYALHALALERLGRTATAAADVALARRWLAKITDAPTLLGSEVNVLISEARVGGRAHPAESVTRLTAAIAAQGDGVTDRIPELELERARLLRFLGEERQAEEALSLAIAAIETGSRRLDSERERSAYAASVREVFDEMIRLQLAARKDPRAALIFAERAMLHEFLTARVTRGRHASANGLAAQQARLGGRQAVLVYRVLDDRLLLWLIGGDRLIFREQPMAAQDLGRLIESFRRSLEEPIAQSAVSDWSGRLSTLLITPVAHGLQGIEQLWIVPDGPLFELPFGALVDPASGNLLVQRFVVVKALTAGLEIEAAAVPSRRRFSPATVLAVGDPQFDGTRFPRLSRLSQARGEALAVAAEYPAAKLLLGDTATRSAFLVELARRDVLHFAGHALPNRENTDLSMLVLASRGSGDEGVVYGKDIEGLALDRLRLVVLAACETSRTAGAAAGLSGLARPFLAAGVPAVIGSLWQVDDRETARFFAAFHHILRGGAADPFTALQRTQRLAFSDRSAARVNDAWAAFEALAASPVLE